MSALTKEQVKKIETELKAARAAQKVLDKAYKTVCKIAKVKADDGVSYEIADYVYDTSTTPAVAAKAIAKFIEGIE